jgi:hypothetical protein
MTQAQFKAQYPRLWRLLNILSYDADMVMREEMGDFSQVRLYELNIQARRLDDKEYELFAIGEESERKALIKDKDLWALDDFLNSAFDGEIQLEIYQL